MKVNFNGMRKSATADMNGLHSVLEGLLLKYADEFLSREKDEIIEAYNKAAQSVDMFNCLYDDSVEGDMDYLSDLSIKRLTEEEKKRVSR